MAVEMFSWGKVQPVLHWISPSFSARSRQARHSATTWFPDDQRYLEEFGISVVLVQDCVLGIQNSFAQRKCLLQLCTCLWLPSRCRERTQKISLGCASWSCRIDVSVEVLQSVRVEGIPLSLQSATVVLKLSVVVLPSSSSDRRLGSMSGQRTPELDFLSVVCLTKWRRSLRLVVDGSGIQGALIRDEGVHFERCQCFLSQILHVGEHGRLGGRALCCSHCARSGVCCGFATDDCGFCISVHKQSPVVVADGCKFGPCACTSISRCLISLTWAS